MATIEEIHCLKEQLELPFAPAQTLSKSGQTYEERLKALLTGELDFHEQDSAYATHVIHSFPAKFPPQLPRLFIEGLTRPGEIVLDPMAGSGTALLEAYLAGRRAIGLDIDPLALRIAAAKVQPVDVELVLKTAHKIIQNVGKLLRSTSDAQFQAEFDAAFDGETRQFIIYWFPPSVYKTLFYLKKEIENLEDAKLRLFFEVAFSSVIITKSGGVSFALDLAHTRPHRAKLVYDEHGNEILRNIPRNLPSTRLKLLTKTLRPVLAEFDKRVRANLRWRWELGFQSQLFTPSVLAGNAKAIPLANETVDLIVTSPPYASNAIDYMRAHKFSLVWFGYPLATLSQHRHQYIGDDGIIPSRETFFPTIVQDILGALCEQDQKKMLSVQRYYSEMNSVLHEMYRVLRPGRSAILVVGTSIIRGIDIRIGDCLSDIGRQIGFDVPAIGIRKLDRDRRMMPASKANSCDSQIQQRMYQEYVIGFYKPLKEW